jgi:large subunit ribosomal protein L7Ae
MSYVDVSLPAELKKKIVDFVKKVTDKGGKVKKGMNECTKTVERGAAKFLVLAGDITPPEVVMHIPKIAQEKKVPYGFVDTKLDLGKAVGIKVGCSALAVTEIPKDADADLKDIVNAIGQLRK